MDCPCFCLFLFFFTLFCTIRSLKKSCLTVDCTGRYTCTNNKICLNWRKITGYIFFSKKILWNSWSLFISTVMYFYSMQYIVIKLVRGQNDKNSLTVVFYKWKKHYNFLIVLVHVFFLLPACVNDLFLNYFLKLTYFPRCSLSAFDRNHKEFKLKSVPIFITKIPHRFDKRLYYQTKHILTQSFMCTIRFNNYMYYTFPWNQFPL